MKKITFLLVFFFASTIYAQAVFKLDSTLVQNWDVPTNQWIDNIKNHYYYDEGGANDTRVYQFMYNNTSWDSISRQTKMYSNNNLAESTFESFDGMQWNYNTKTELSYNSNNQVALEEGYLYTGIWLNNSSLENTYDVSGNLTEELYKAIDFVSSQLVNDKKNLYTYDMNNLLEQDISQIWLVSDWFNQIRRDHFYLPNNLVDYIDRFDWLGATWSGIKERTLFFYGSNDLVIEVRSQTDSGGILENDSRVLNTYDTSPNLIQVTGQEWNGLGWDNLSNLIQNYDVDNNIEEQISQIWDVPNNQWLNQIRTTSYWSLTESLSVAFIDVLDASIYPNPTTNILQVQLSNPCSHDLEIKLFDMSGRQVDGLFVNKGTQVFKIPIIQQSSGTYIVKINGVDGSQTFRVIKN